MARLISPIPEPERGGDFLSNIKRAAEDLFTNFKRSASDFFGSKISNSVSSRPTESFIQSSTPDLSPSPTITPTQKSSSLARNPAISRFQLDPQVIQAINQAAQQYNVIPSLLFDIALQESSFNPKSDPFAEGRGDIYKQAGYPKGLFQITEPTLRTLKRYGNMPDNTLSVPNWDVFDPISNALMAAYLIGHGQLGRWDASKNVWGPFYSEEELSPYYRQTLSRRR